MADAPSFSWTKAISSTVAIVIGAPLLYYSYVETRRFSIISKREKRFRIAEARRLQVASEDDQGALLQNVAQLYASLRIGGRFVNPYRCAHRL